MRFRVIATLAVFVASLGVLAVSAGSAGATGAKAAIRSGLDPSIDPQTTNIPWLAWAGETVKVSRCFGLNNPVITLESFQASPDYVAGLTGEFDKADWSGAADQPPFFQTGTGDETSRQVTPNWQRGGGVCFSVDVTSEKAGLEKIKFSIPFQFQGIRIWLDSVLGGDVIFQQDLYVIWMWDSAPTLSESSDVGAYVVGDPGGSGTYEPIADPTTGYKSFQPGLVHVTVSGTFPLGNDYASYDFTGTKLHNGTITLPDDWAWLAQHFAEDYSVTSTYPGAASLRWDIHDDDLNTEGHVPASGCTTEVDPLLTVDAVDNCNGSGKDPDLGPFSSIFGQVGLLNDAIGPFDPLRPLQTLLADGKLDASDAPMPALRVDVTLTNAGEDHAAGYLSKADKSLIYNREEPQYGGNGDDAGEAHNLYAPFYKALIPAVIPLPLFPLPTSGVEGSFAGDYSNWLTSGIYGLSTSEQYPFLYDYWDTFTLDSTGGVNDCYGADGRPISLPDSVQQAGTGTSVAVYTDEHGEAYVQFNPANPDGEGIVLTPDSNGRCDPYIGRLAGTAVIQAESVYPAQQPEDPANSGKAKTSNTLTKTVDFQPSKVLSCVPKGTNEAFCVEYVTDFEGNPLGGVRVEFSAAAGQGSAPTIGADSAVVGTLDTTGQYIERGGPVIGGFVRVRTNDLGMAGIYVHSSTNACIDVTAENVGTRHPATEGSPTTGAGVTRDTDFNPTSGTACTLGGTNNTGGTPPAGTPGGTPTPGGTSSQPTGGTAAVATPVAITAPAPTAAPQLVPTTTTKPAAKTVKLTLVSARVIATGTGRYLTVRVNSAAKLAKLRITLVGKNGSRHVVLRTVPTNRVVRVPNLKLAPTITSVRVAIA